MLITTHKRLFFLDWLRKLSMNPSIFWKLHILLNILRWVLKWSIWLFIVFPSNDRKTIEANGRKRSKQLIERLGTLKGQERRITLDPGRSNVLKWKTFTLQKRKNNWKIKQKRPFIINNNRDLFGHF